MDGAASPAADEEEPSGGAAHIDRRSPAAPETIVPEDKEGEGGQGYVYSLLRASLQLLRKEFPPKVRRQGLKLMLHLLRFRWDELLVEWNTFSDVADMVAGSYGTTSTIPSKSSIATLVAEVISSGGVSSLIDLLPSIFHLSKRGPTGAGLAASIVKWISDFSIVCPVDLELGGEGNQDGDATYPPSASNTMPSPSCYLTLGLRPWALNGEATRVACFHDLPTTQPSFDSCSVPSFPKSNGTASTLDRKKLDHNLIHDPQLYCTSFPLCGCSVSMSWLRLGTKSQNRVEGKSLSLSPEYRISTKNRSSSSLACSSSCLALVEQRQQLHANGELQTDVSSFTQVGKGIAGTMSCPQEKGQLLLVEHNILSEAFVIMTSFPRIQDMEHLLIDLLKNLNKIWTQSDWEDKYMREDKSTRYRYRLSGLLANNEFRRTVRSLVKSFEELIGNRIVVCAGARVGCSSVSADYVYSHTLPKLMLPLILRILDRTQMHWMERIAYDLSGVTPEGISFLLENGKLPDLDEDKMLQNAEIWSQGIREIGYNVIGLCASVEGAFCGLLDRSLIINVYMENLLSMDFNQLGKLIQLVFIPLVKYCPHECWDEWMVALLKPVFSYCEEILYYAWFTFLYEGRAKNSAYFGNPNGPEEIVNRFEKEVLLKFTRSVSDLLGVLASDRLNSGLPHGSNTSTKADVQDLKSISSNSIIGYLLLHNCFGRLNMYLFGCFVDYQAVEKALPFCYALIRVAVTANHETLNHFIRNEMLPIIILLLGGDLDSEISKLSCSLNSTRKEDARNKIIPLCQEIYEVYIENQLFVVEGADKANMSSCFEDWLATELQDLRSRASCAVPEDFPKDLVMWNWEFNEEFERYLPAYINMLEEVDAMDDCLKVDYVNRKTLFEKLKPEFRSRYGIDSCEHPYLRSMTYYMLQRKRVAVLYRTRAKWISELLIQLITRKPYIKHTDYWDDNVWGHLEEPQCDPLQHDVAGAINIFCNAVLFYWEPQFHPLIRESHVQLLTTIAHQLALAEGRMFEPLEPHPDDFLVHLQHLQPYAFMYIKRKKRESGYYRIKEQARLHEEFDNHLASGSLDHRMDDFSFFKDGFLHEDAISYLKNSPFATLDHDLIKMSFERRAKIVGWEHQISSYSQCLKSLLENDEMKDRLGSLMKVLNAEGFFRVNDDSIDWDNKLFSDSVEKFNELVFSGQCIDKSLVIRGMLDYQKILEMEDVDWQDAFRVVVSNKNDLWKENLRQFWMTARHYEHDYYDILAQPLQKVFLRGGAPKPKYG